MSAQDARDLVSAPYPTHTEGDWTGGRAWPVLLEQIATYFAAFERDRAGVGTFTEEELAQEAGNFATGLADHIAALPTPAAPIDPLQCALQWLVDQKHIAEATAVQCESAVRAGLAGSA